jgi:hypothetical protein
VPSEGKEKVLPGTIYYTGWIDNCDAKAVSFPDPMFKIKISWFKDLYGIPNNPISKMGIIKCVQWVY